MYIPGTAFLTTTESVIPEVHTHLDIVRLPSSINYLPSDVMDALTAHRAEGQPPIYILSPEDVGKWVPFIRALHGDLVLEVVTPEQMSQASVGPLATVAKVPTDSIEGLLSNSRSEGTQERAVSHRSDSSTISQDEAYEDLDS